MRQALPTRRAENHLKFIAQLLGSDAAASVIAVLLCIVMVPAASAVKHKKDAADDTLALPKKFKGKLPITQLTEEEAINHALNRLAYGPRLEDVERIRRMGLEKWVDQQLSPDSIDDSALDARLRKYPTLKMSSKDLLEEFPQPAQAAKQEGVTKEEIQEQLREKRREAMTSVLVTGDDNLDKAQLQLAMIQGPGRIVAELSMAKVDRAIYSRRQLEAVMEDFWFNHFNVFANKGADRWLLTSYMRDTLRPRAMGKFDDLLLATAKSPAMLFFLDNWQSVDPEAFQQWRESRRRFQGIFRGGFAPMPGEFPRPNARIPEFPAPAQPQQERGLNENYGREVMELHTIGVDAGYTQQDVIEMAKCLTGWTIREPRRDPEYVFKPEFHAEGKKVVMGHTFDFGGEKDGDEALRMLANEPHAAAFISTELARHFVSDDPPQSLIDRMTKEYEQTGGDIKDVLRTMIYSPEFWSKNAYRAKVKTPFELVASTARALNADISVTLPVAQWVGRLGEPLFLCEPPTGYSDKAATWVNTGALLNRLNFALSFAGNHMLGATVDLSAMLGDEASRDPEMTLARALDVFLDGQMASGTRDTLEERLKDPQVLQAKLDDPVKKVNEGLISGLVLGAPEFQRR
ncbi:MAG: DUF1800 domain-containing protein [Candidatus Acidiferrales bacterium]